MLYSNGRVSSIKVNGFLFGFNYDNVTTEFRNNDINQKGHGCPCGGKARHIGENVDDV